MLIPSASPTSALIIFAASLVFFWHVVLEVGVAPDTVLLAGE